ncbi:hypothetical protein V5799_015821 [Amblyomma americanum]|uniref:Uncharacterized protein n=1 Tax=Amblyomma americanum TaxID=6943 RepID=A0AAQ4F7L4_AMBAM
MHRLTLIACLGFVSAVSSNPLIADDDICSTAGKLCGKVPCVPHQDPQYFTCQCGKEQYFNATAQRCYHTRSCGLYPCSMGTCEDNDGNAERSCRCMNFKNVAPNCLPENAFKIACGDARGEIQQTEDGVTCRCPEGMKWEENECKSIACTNKDDTCVNICYNKPLLEDKRCCQGWDTASCSAVHEESTYCKPGTISIGQHLNCTNVCAAGQSECEYQCAYTDVRSSEYTCLCPPEQVLNSDQRTCSDRTSCNSQEEKNCSAIGKQCMFENGKAKCSCADDNIELNDTCTEQTCDREESWSYMRITMHFVVDLHRSSNRSLKETLRNEKICPVSTDYRTQMTK